jgi:hypothetical protein
MAFSLPTMNLTVNIWRRIVFPGAPTYIVAGNLQYGRRYANNSFGVAPPGPDAYPPTMSLLLPPRTDVQDAVSAPDGDIVEVPAGTGRYYEVIGVDDVGRGFPNEFRLALLTKFPPWPAPIP